VKRLALAFVLVAGCGDNNLAGNDAGGDDRCLVDGEIDLDGDLCERLSTYGLFDDAHAQDPAEGVIPYGLNTALFSDYAAKYRFFAFPEGATFAWQDEDAFDYSLDIMLQPPT